MKKLICLILAVLCLTLCACGNRQNKDGEDEEKKQQERQVPDNGNDNELPLVPLEE